MSHQPTEALDNVLQLATMLTTDMARFEQDTGLTSSRIHLLWVLGLTKPSTQQALARALDVTSRNITGLVDGLVLSGHVTREPHPTDRRATLVTPTELGRRSIRDLHDRHDDLARQLFGAVPAPQLTVFLSTLEDSIAAFRRLAKDK